MEFKNQQVAIQQLHDLADADRHSILIEGIEGSGKSYLAKEYAKILNIVDMISIQPNVNEVRDAIDACYTVTNNVLICIENLDTGLPSASYTLLKFLEEPMSNVYIVVTCRNINRVPDTIVSRSAVVSLAVPIDQDIALYAEKRDSMQYSKLSQYKFWDCVRSFKDVDTLMSMSNEQKDYFLKELPEVFRFKDPESTISWKLTKYPDNTETPLSFVVRYIMATYSQNRYITKACIECLSELDRSRVAPHASISKLIFECMYGG